MRKLIRFLRLPSSDRQALMKAVFLLWAVRIGLWVLPFQTLRDLVNRRKKYRMVASNGDSASVQRIAQSVTLMSQYVPATTCLVQALVMVALLEKAGLPACLRIGVDKSTAGKLEAHAWVESMDQVVMGGADVDLSRYTVLQSVEGT